jgi:RNA polymerase sigma-70 factor (ECF subfamily)
LRELIADLPERQRAVVLLRYQEDLDPSEICTIVGLPVNTVKSHLHRALRSLRAKLGEA